MHSNFRSRLKAGDLLISPMISLASPETAEVLSRVGFDWLFIDGEHGTFSTSELQAVIARVDHALPCIVRVEAPAEAGIKKALDVGATGIIAPQVNSASLAEQVVQWSKYSPEGSRGVGVARAHGYGLSFNDYVSVANENVVVIVQAEHIDAVENMEAIVKVPGIDAVFIGPYDLSASLGKIGEVDHPDVVNAIEHVTQVCCDAGVALGIFGVSPEAVQPYIDKGYTLITAGVDTVMLGQAGRRIVSKLK